MIVCKWWINKMHLDYHNAMKLLKVNECMLWDLCLIILWLERLVLNCYYFGLGQPYGCKLRESIKCWLFVCEWHVILILKVLVMPLWILGSHYALSMWKHYVSNLSSPLTSWGGKIFSPISIHLFFKYNCIGHCHNTRMVSC